MNDRKRRISFKAKLLVLLLLALILIGGGFGILFGTGTGGEASGMGVTSVPSVSASPSVYDVYTIVISGRNITFRGDNYSLGGLKEKLLREYTGTEKYTLLDDRAIKAVYDSVKTLLGELDIEYSEK